MKTINLTKLTLVTGTLLTLSLTAQAGILGSPHDFHSRGWNADQTDPATVCSVCHIPHHADPNSGPLWGHAVISTTGWKMYANPTYASGVISAGSPGANIKYCLLYTSPSPRDGLLSRMPSSA